MWFLNTLKGLPILSLSIFTQADQAGNPWKINPGTTGSIEMKDIKSYRGSNHVFLLSLRFFPDMMVRIWGHKCKENMLVDALSWLWHVATHVLKRDCKGFITYIMRIHFEFPLDRPGICFWKSFLPTNATSTSMKRHWQWAKKKKETTEDQHLCQLLKGSFSKVFLVTR